MVSSRNSCELEQKEEMLPKSGTKMKFKSKVAKFTGERKIVEIPESIRDNFKIGEEVTILKKTGGKK